jgi:hypothetical protein
MTSAEVRESMNELISEFMGKHKQSLVRIRNFDSAWDKFYEMFWEYVRVNHRDSFMKLKALKFGSAPFAELFTVMHFRLKSHLWNKSRTTTRR